MVVFTVSVIVASMVAVAVILIAPIEDPASIATALVAIMEQ